jgi:hypothetical protein
MARRRGGTGETRADEVNVDSPTANESQSTVRSERVQRVQDQ